MNKCTKCGHNKFKTVKKTNKIREKVGCIKCGTVQDANNEIVDTTSAKTPTETTTTTTTAIETTTTTTTIA